MRVRNSKPAPSREALRELRLRATRLVSPRKVEHNGAQFIIAPNGMRVALQYAETHMNQGLADDFSLTIRLAMLREATPLS